MFTIKWITPSGEEFLYSTNYTNFVPNDARSVPSVQPGDSFWIAWPSDENRYEFTEGMIYAMNERGATVARHYLGSASAPKADESGLPAPTDRRPGETLEDYANRSSVGVFRAAESKAQGAVSQETSTAPSCGSTAGTSNFRKFVDTGGND